jgi:GntR family transcriptional regulator
MAELGAIRAERQPLFESIGAVLKREIVAGRFAQSDLLPGERELSQMLEVSRTTLRRAIAGLIEDGLLVHRHGAGTFVRRSPPHVEQPLSRLTSFTEDMRLRGLVASSKDIERGVFLPTPEESMMLDIALSETVFRLSRLRLADGVPMAIERAAVPMRFLGGDADRVGDSLYAALEGSGFRPVRGVQRLRAVVVGPAEAAALEIAEGQPALDIHRVAYVSDGRRVEFTRSTYRSDTYDFVAELTLPPSARARVEGAPR